MKFVKIFWFPQPLCSGIWHVFQIDNHVPICALHISVPPMKLCSWWTLILTSWFWFFIRRKRRWLWLGAITRGMRYNINIRWKYINKKGVHVGSLRNPGCEYSWPREFPTLTRKNCHRGLIGSPLFNNLENEIGLLLQVICRTRLGQTPTECREKRQPWSFRKSTWQSERGLLVSRELL